MMIHEITKSVGKYKARKRIGRGEGSGNGKTAGRGHKGAASRSGWKKRTGFEGGQMPLIRRMPKRGFPNTQFRRLFHVVNVRHLETHCSPGAAVTVESLAGAGLIRDTSLPLKILGDGELSKKLDVTAAKFSESARKKIEAAGGTVTVVVRKKWVRSATPRNKAKSPDQPAAKADKPDKSDKPAKEKKAAKPKP